MKESLLFKILHFFKKSFKKIEIFCIQEELDKILETIMTKASTGKVGDGKIFVSDVDEVTKIRTQERVKHLN